jgi:hypothetical protein
VKPGQAQPAITGPVNSRQQLLDRNEEQMIIKSAYASNHELIKKIVQSDGQYIRDIQTIIRNSELDIIKKKYDNREYLSQGDCIN